jgi:hypothetical protein
MNVHLGKTLGVAQELERLLGAVSVKDPLKQAAFSDAFDFALFPRRAWGARNRIRMS